MIMVQQSACESGSKGGLERTRYFGHQLVGPEDLTADQEYFREKLRRHNRMLHGWGVVCGTCVRRGSGDCEVVIEPGYILGPYGNEIVIDAPHSIDLCSLGTDQECGCCGGGSKDPWCGEERQSCSPGTKYLAVKYEECLARPVRKLAGSCGGGCDEDCEYSRIREGYTVSLLSELPPGYTTPMRPADRSAMLPCPSGNPRPCPPCAESPWVILADVSVGADCTITGINCFRHRRYAVTWAPAYHLCTPEYMRPDGRPQDADAVWATYGMMAVGDTVMFRDRDASGAQPHAMVMIARTDGSSAALPANFEVLEGDTFGTVLEREGERSYFDPVTGVDFTLGDLAAAAGVDHSRPVANTSEVLAAFEGLRVDLPALRSGRAIFSEMVDSAGVRRLDREHSGTLGHTSRLPVTDLKGVSNRSFVGKKVADMSVHDVAAMSREDFVEKATKGSGKSSLDSNRELAKKTWENANRLIEATAGVARRL